MASGRILKTQISISEQVNELSIKATLLFTWMIPHADDFGRLIGNPKRLKALIFPMREDFTFHEVETCLFEIQEKNLITLYFFENEKYIQINSFERHQNGLHKRTKSRFPDPSNCEKFREIPGNSGKFREIPGNSRPIEEKRREEKRTEENVLEFPEGNSLSSKLDEISISDKKNAKTIEFKQKAEEVLRFLNRKSGKNYRAVDTNLKMIIARLKSGATVQDCKSVIARKQSEWGSDEKMEKYLRPATLFNATKFEQYFGELVEETEENVRAN